MFHASITFGLVVYVAGISPLKAVFATPCSMCSVPLSTAPFSVPLVSIVLFFVDGCPRSLCHVPITDAIMLSRSGRSLQLVPPGEQNDEI